MIGNGEKAKLLRDIDRHLELACRYAVQFTRPTLWVVCGMPASGKSTISDALSGALQIKVLRSDLVRKALFGVETEVHMDLPFEEGVYSEQSSSLVYGRLLLLAQEEIEKGSSVILDATFSRKQQRREVARLAQDMDCNIVFVECTCSESTSRDRLLEREKTTGVSDARIHHFPQFKSRFEPLDDVHRDMHIRINTDRPLEESIRKVFIRDHVLLSGWIARKERVF
jgi:predicted kinase